jgi:signal transduction histidine kinase
MRLRPPRSLIVRILIAEIATIILSGALLWQVTAGLLNRTVDRFQERGLLAQAAAVLKSATMDRHGAWAVDLPAQLRPIYDTGYDGRAYVLLDESGRLLSASRFAQPQIALEAPRLDRQALFHHDQIVGLSLPSAIQGRRLWTVVTINERRPGAILDDVQRAFLLDYVGILVGLLLFLPLVNGLVIRRMVRAISRVSDRAGVIGTEALDQRLDAAGVPAEVAPLVRATNGLLDRLEASFRRQSEFSANLAHELRTPLATLKAQLDALEDRALRAQTALQIDRIVHILSQLRDLAALEDMHARALDAVDLPTIAIDVIARLAPRALADGHDLALDGVRAVSVQGNATLIELALANLIDNAIKHTPGGTHISVTVLAAGAIEVRDDGPGVATSERPIRRFWRADWNRTDGAGLGLSIVQRIMEVHGGSLEQVDTAPGACFCLRFRLLSAAVETGTARPA